MIDVFETTIDARENHKIAGEVGIGISIIYKRERGKVNNEMDFFEEFCKKYPSFKLDDFFMFSENTFDDELD